MTSQIMNTNNPNSGNGNSRGKHHQERQQLDRRYQNIRKSIAKNANNLFNQEPVSYEITPPPTLPPDRQRELLVSVSNVNNILRRLQKLQKIPQFGFEKLD